MSASHVRNTTRNWAQAISAIAGNPQYYDTINVEVDPSDAVWWTMEYQAEFFQGTFCARNYLENGFIRLIVFAQPGTGDTACVAGLETIVPQMLAQIDPTQRLVIETYEPAQEASGGSADSTYRLSVLLNYKLSL